MNFLSENNSKYRQQIVKSRLFHLILITIGITIFLLIRQSFIGIPYYDVFVYLNNALIFAGIPVGNMSVIYLSPLMPFFTSLVFRLGLISENVIFILDGIVFLLGVVFLYLLFKERFNDIKSFTGAIIFISFPLVYTWAVSGGIDIPAVSFSILAIYTLVAGVEKNSKLLYFVFPLLALAFLAKYTSAILIFPMILYLLMSKSLVKNVEKIGLGILVGLAVISPFFIFIYFKLGNLDPLINIFTSTLWGSGATSNDLGYNPLKLYFLNNILNYISTGPFIGIYSYIQSPSRGFPSILSYLIAVVTVIGFSIYLHRILLEKLENFDISGRNKTILYSIILLILTAFGILSFFTMAYMVTEFIFLTVFYGSYLLLKNQNNIKDLKIDFLFLSWFVAFFIFHSVIPLKEDRYFITMSPALAYFIILGVSVVIEKFKFKFKQNWLRSNGMYLIVAFIFLTSMTAVYAGHTPQNGYGYYMQSASDWLKTNDLNYQSKIIYSNYDPALTWYFKKEVKFGVPRLYTSADSFSNYLKEENADYYIDTYSTQPYIPGFHIIHSVESISIYKRNS